MTRDVFERFGSFIHSEYGIKMPPVKRTMLESRLRRRLKALGLENFREYCEYVFSPEGQKYEVVHMMDAVTTNKTEFFREPEHFEFLEAVALPDLCRRRDCSTRPLSVWSAGCSSGEEVYSLAMVLSEFGAGRPAFSFTVTGTDLSSRALDAAVRGVYAGERIYPVPDQLRRKYFMKSRDRRLDLVRVVPELRGRTEFYRMNLLQEKYGLYGKIDVIFCRNVIIYFERSTQETIVRRICSYLPAGGYLFMGHSETLSNMNLPVAAVAPAVYRRR